jgi:GT2 family glycosyltransferase
MGADLFWILNADLVVDPNSLSELVKNYHENGNQIYGSVSLNPKDPELVDFGGAEYGPQSDSKLTYNSWKHKPYRELLAQYQNSYDVESVEGSSMLIPMSVIEKYGFMKLDFFMYGEETDYCYRMRKHGVKSILVTSSFVKHHNEGSTQQFPKLKIIPIYYRRRNVLRFSIEHFGMSRWEALSYYNGAYLNLKTILKGLFSKKKELHYFYALACLHAFLGKKGKCIQPEKLLY